MTEKHTAKGDIRGDLDTHKSRSEKFRARIADLQSSIQFGMDPKHKLYYTVDFSEIYSYLHYGDPNVTNLGVSIAPVHEVDQTKIKDQHYLALTHLFKTFTKSPLYLLQPYLLEMYSYTQNQAHRSARLGQDLNDQIKQFVDGLSNEHKDLLKSAKSKNVSAGQDKKLLELLVTEYPGFSILLLEYERWHALNTRGQLLNKMIADKRLTNRIDEILAAYDLRPHELKTPSLEEEEKIAAAFPSHPGDKEKVHAREQSRKLDARALLILRNLNRLLEPHGARMVLITRDQKSPAVAQQLEKEEWFGWTDVRKYFCDIESVYLDLILHSLKDEEKLQWLQDADNELTKIITCVDQLKEELGPQNIPIASVRELSANAKELLNRNSQHWNKLIDVEFIRVSPEISWLGEDLLEAQLFGSSQAGGGTNSRVEASTKSLLQTIVDLVDSPTVQQLASDDVDVLWNNIYEDVHQMNSLSQFSGDLNDVLNHLKEILSKSYDNPVVFRSIVARSKSFTNMPDIHFKKKEYRDFVKNFEPWNYKKEGLVDEVGRELSGLFSLAFANKDKPESYLFMAFILGMLDNWSQAIELAKHGRELLDKVNPEFNFFLAYAVWQDIKKRNESDKLALPKYLWAIELMWEALKANPIDPRYLDRQGTTALEYHDIVRQLEGNGETVPPEILNSKIRISSETEAFGFLEQALNRAGNDRKLRVRILNNLAYSYGTIEPPNLQKAEEFHKQVINELGNVKQDNSNPLPEFEKWQFVMDTRWYIGAKLAFFKENVGELQHSIDNLVSLQQKASLNDSERRVIKSHLDETREWLDKLRASQVMN
jgi:hypothetical protein